MSIKVVLQHRTTSSYAEPVTVHPHVVRLRPAPVTCQGVPVPLQPTGPPAEMYAGVRYRAWRPRSVLHHTLDLRRTSP